MDEIQKLPEQRAKLIEQAQALEKAATAEDRDLTAEEAEKVDALLDEAETLENQIKTAESAARRTGRLTEAANSLGASNGRRVPPTTPGTPGIPGSLNTNEDRPTIVVPARVYPAGSLRAFSSPERAYAAAQWVRAINGIGSAQRWCDEHGIGRRWFDDQDDGAQAVIKEDTNISAGYLVEPEFDSELIKLMLNYGVFRRNARIKPMASDTKSTPRRKGGLTAYFVAEGGAGTESDPTYDRVGLTAKKIMTLTRMSNEFGEDAMIDMVDELFDEIAQAFAYKEDLCGFLGDGTSTYGGIHGVSPRLIALNGVDDGGGLVLGAGDTFAEITLANLTKLVGFLPTYARANAKWYCSPLFYYSVMVNLLTAAGGNTIQNLQAGESGELFLGYPRELTEVLPTADAVSQVCCLFGDLQKAAQFGDRRQRTLAFSTEATVGGESMFERDERGVRGTERFDINVHDVGTATAAGPIVGLITAAS